MPQFKTSKEWRVKLYELEAQGAWLDKGTGHVKVHLTDGSSEPALLMIDEDTKETVLHSKIPTDDIYERQGG